MCLQNHNHKIVHSSAMHYQNLIIIRECSKKLLEVKNRRKKNLTPSISYIVRLVEVPWYIGVNPWLWIKGLRVRFLSMPGTFVLQQDTLSTLLLSTQAYKWVSGRMWSICCVCICLNATTGSSARNAPLGVEIVHCKCGLKLYPTTGVIIVCCALNILAGWICAHYKCSYYY